MNQNLYGIFCDKLKDGKHQFAYESCNFVVRVYRSDEFHFDVAEQKFIPKGGVSAKMAFKWTFTCGNL